jgi:hypothetical protein
MPPAYLRHFDGWSAWSSYHLTDEQLALRDGLSYALIHLPLAILHGLYSDKFEKDMRAYDKQCMERPWDFPLRAPMGWDEYPIPQPVFIGAEPGPDGDGVVLTMVACGRLKKT